MIRHPSWNIYAPPAGLPSTLIHDPTRPLVSIVTPSYNQGSFLRATLDSVLGQDYPNIEYWVMDGGSTDETLAVLHDYASDPRLHWCSAPDHGQADAINKGWARCRGEILAWLNSDDTYLPGAIQAQVAVLEARPEVGLVYGDCRYTDAQGNDRGAYIARDFDRRRHLRLPAIPQPTAFLRRSLLEQHGLLNPHLHYALDFELFLRLMWHTHFFYHRRPIATYRLHNASKTVSHYKHSISETLLVVQQTCARHADALPPGEQRRLMSDWLWLGAMDSLDSGSYTDTLAYSLAALSIAPFRPRMMAFLLKCIDRRSHAKTHQTLVHMIRRAEIRASHA